MENFGAMQDNSNETLQYLERIPQYEYCDIISAVIKKRLNDIISE